MQIKRIKVSILKTNVLLLGFLLLCSRGSFATTLEEMSLNELVRSSHACVVATAIGTKYASENGSVFTYTKFRVSETAFGSTAEIITVKTPGGERKLGRLAVADVVPGAPRFFDNQNNVLFLQKSDQADQYLINGFSQGALGVRESNQGEVVELRTAGEVSVEQAVEEIQELRSANN